MTLQEIIDEVFARHDAECLRLTKERDELRREICSFDNTRFGARLEATKRGWDCYKEETP
jgi:hypothetical protein